MLTTKKKKKEKKEKHKFHGKIKKEKHKGHFHQHPKCSVALHFSYVKDARPKGLCVIAENPGWMVVRKCVMEMVCKNYFQENRKTINKQLWKNPKQIACCED